MYQQNSGKPTKKKRENASKKTTTCTETKLKANLDGIKNPHKTVREKYLISTPNLISVILKMGIPLIKKMSAVVFYEEP